jgi:hypothetical protein
LAECNVCNKAEKRDLYAAGYRAGWLDAIRQVRRLARMNPFLTRERGETLLALVLRFEHQMRPPVGKAAP